MAPYYSETGKPIAWGREPRGHATPHRKHDAEANACCLGRGADAYFWDTQSRAELDLMLIRKGRLWGYEIKYHEPQRLL